MIQKSSKINASLIFCHNIANILFIKFRFPGSRKLSRMISKIILPPLKERTICPTIYGFDLVLSPENGLEIYNLGFYEIGTLNVLKHCLNKGDIFIDVGASIGLMSFYGSTLVGLDGKIVAFEPVSKSYSDLTDSIKVNRSENIIALKLGLGSKKESLPIYTSRACPSLVSYEKDEPNEVVEIETLDTVLTDLKITEVKMIKIDVEGFELEVLKGASHLLTQANAPIICIEYIKKMKKIEENGEGPLNFIKKINKYRFFQLKKTSNTISQLYEIKDEMNLHDADNVFCFLDAHLTTLSKSLFV